MREPVKRTKGRPSKIEPVKPILSRLLKNNPKCNDKEIRNLLLSELPNLISKGTLQSEEDLPGVYRIGEFRRKEFQENSKTIEKEGLDIPWHIGTLLEHPLPPETTAKIIEWKMGLTDNQKELLKEHPLTIRQALWMDRLSAIPMSSDNLYMIASAYSSQEVIMKLAGSDKSDLSPTYDDSIIEFLKIIRNHKKTSLVKSNLKFFFSGEPWKLMKMKERQKANERAHNSQDV